MTSGINNSTNEPNPHTTDPLNPQTDMTSYLSTIYPQTERPSSSSSAQANQTQPASSLHSHPALSPPRPSSEPSEVQQLKDLCGKYAPLADKGFIPVPFKSNLGTFVAWIKPTSELANALLNQQSEFLKKTAEKISLFCANLFNKLATQDMTLDQKKIFNGLMGLEEEPGQFTLKRLPTGSPSISISKEINQSSVVQTYSQKFTSGDLQKFYTAGVRPPHNRSSQNGSSSQPASRNLNMDYVFGGKHKSLRPNSTKRLPSSPRSTKTTSLSLPSVSPRRFSQNQQTTSLLNSNPNADLSSTVANLAELVITPFTKSVPPPIL